MTGIDIAHLQTWIGRTEESRDVIAPAHVRRMAALLDRPAPARGEALPPLWHWTFFTPEAPQSQIGPDGHPRRGGFLPPVPLPRRMWAGGRLTFHAPIHVGEEVSRTSEILSVTEKSGRQGALVFLTVRHSLATGAGLAIEEEQDIVYREPSTSAQPAAVAEVAPADWRDPLDPDPVLLFRYSALTFNAHRIHYDLPYATGEEGYPGLVVHGPLTATLLMEGFVRHIGKPPRSFSFRGQAPLFAGGRMQVCGRITAEGHDLWAEGPGGYTGMSARVTA
ncbi:FAS1-like dehydratase domain-containing protein [Paracoccus versutus]|uniref:FAS1-like dehydratase domain-containing protein n=1 Tax=Paracoccus versutus TaxID=34007 RepID=UPI000DF867F2|nr:MaoC family dehydratase N-terminal domain-containing protein [Paracoccus versutus]RDD69036.1 acyl-CoA dehydrogenase [Paracoccus versutus]